MASTPEGRVKDKIRKLLREYRERVWFTQPVPYGYGESTLDFICGVRLNHWLAMFFIEAKAPGKHPTPRQQQLIGSMMQMGAPVFIIDGDDGLDELRTWIEGMINGTHPTNPV